MQILQEYILDTATVAIDSRALCLFGHLTTQDGIRYAYAPHMQLKALYNILYILNTSNFIIIIKIYTLHMHKARRTQEAEHG